MLFFYKNKGNQQSVLDDYTGVFYVEVNASITSLFLYVLVK